MNRRIRVAGLGLALLASQLVLVDGAEARAGRARSMRGTSVYRSMGDRGVRTDRNWGNTANPRPGFQQPMGNARPGMGMPQQPSWTQRNPFVSGMLGGLAGSAVWSGISGLFGGHHGGYGSGYGNGYGYGSGQAGGGGFGILPLLLLLGGGWWLFRKLSRNNTSNTFAPGFPSWNNRGVDPSMTTGPGSTVDARFSAISGFGGAAAVSQTLEQGLAAIQLNSPGLTRQGLEDKLSGIFFAIQEAWSNQDEVALTRLGSPEIAARFSQDLDEARRNGERNILKNIVIKSFDIGEAWTEEDREFVSARIQARLIDYVEKQGRVIEGNADSPTDFAEVWTFARERGGEVWKLSAIEQL